MSTIFAELERELSQVYDYLQGERLLEAGGALDRIEEALDEGTNALSEVAENVEAYRRERDGYRLLRGYLLAVSEALDHGDSHLASQRFFESRQACRSLADQAVPLSKLRQSPTANAPPATLRWDRTDA